MADERHLQTIVPMLSPIVMFMLVKKTETTTTTMAVTAMAAMTAMTIRMPMMMAIRSWMLLMPSRLTQLRVWILTQTVWETMPTPMMTMME